MVEVLLTTLLLVARMTRSAPVALARHAQLPVLRGGDHLQAVAPIQSLLSHEGFRAVVGARFARAAS